MLAHHDSRDYDVAASEAAKNARQHLESMIATGRQRAGAVIEKVQREVPEDFVIPGGKLEFRQRDRGLALHWEGQRMVEHGFGYAIHDHALSQACERGGIPFRFAQELLKKDFDDPNGVRIDWGSRLLAHNLNETLAHTRSRYLVRTVGTEARGFLSDRFRRLDSRPILDAFCQAASEVGAVPIEGYALDTKIAIKALLPMVFEPVPNEVMAFGVMFGNSDFGDGALSMRVFMLRLWCTNYAITDEALRQVHLGGQLPDDVTFSEQTYVLDTKRSASMVRDIIGGELAPARVRQACDLVRRANEEKVVPSALAAFLKRHVLKGEAESIVEAYNSPDVLNLPPGNTSWRASNAISWIAGQAKDEGRKLDLMKVAALALPGQGQLHADRN